MAKVHVLLTHDVPLKVFGSKRRAEAAMLDLAETRGFKINREMFHMTFGTHLVDSDGRSTGLALHSMDVE